CDSHCEAKEASMTAFRFMDRSAKSLIGVIAALVMLVSVVSTVTAQPTPGLQYTFVQGVDDLTKAGGITDLSGHGHNGTVIDAAFAQLVTGPASNMNEIHIDPVNG